MTGMSWDRDLALEAVHHKARKAMPYVPRAEEVLDHRLLGAILASALDPFRCYLFFFSWQRSHEQEGANSDIPRSTPECEGGVNAGEHDAACVGLIVEEATLQFLHPR